ncbi:hypothetical protein AFR_41940 [Actinoplanes friuliensis DSM 7358]|uniref:Uncharacterized protein n=1 Tax=Actinoplanes friuliensis DSM 7358 TaxID=1246995 RepID=U5WCE7_9ACTN|nr:hypothetical protein AFR_41940 [Actinoplanes friuliensis DSM 7358]
MSVSVDNRRTRTRPALTAVLTVLILVPAAILFARVWGTISDERDSAKREKQGVEYISALAPLVSALAEAQSSALAGVSAAPGSLTAAVNGVAAVDQRLGEDLSTRERWTGLRQKIEQLPKVTGSPLIVFQAHVEVTDLSLALYSAVRNNSELVRDPDNDISHLQQAVAIDLPAAVVQVSRMGDLSQLVAKGNAQLQSVLGPQFGAAVQSVNLAVNSLTDNLQSAVDDTNSTTLSGNLVSGLDSFRRGVESLTRGANLGGVPNTATMATAQSQLQVSLSNLSGIVSREMTALLDDRLDDLDTQTLVALAAAGAAVLLTIAAVIVPLTGRRRRSTGTRPGESTRDMTVGPTGSDPGRRDLGAPAPAYGEANPTRRERSGALR